MNMLNHRHPRPLPEIIRIVLREIGRRRISGDLSPELFQKQLSRLCREELQPRGLVLLERALPNGSTRFLVKEEKGGTVREMIDCGLSA